MPFSPIRRIRTLVLLVTCMGALAALPSAASAATCPADTAAVPSRTYLFTHLDGTTTTRPIINGAQPGDKVSVSFTVAPGCTDYQLTLASYRATSANGRPFPDQVVFSSQTGFFSEGTYTNALTITVPGLAAAPGDASQCDQVAYPPGGNGANTSGPYDPTCNGSPSLNGKGDGNANGKPCAGCVGNADAKNPPGQMPNGNDPNAGYECDRNQGVGQSNPAHTGCTFFQLDLYSGPLITSIPADGGIHPQVLFDASFGPF
jgi:hypothetical protein